MTQKVRSWLYFGLTLAGVVAVVFGLTTVEELEDAIVVGTLAATTIGTLVSRIFTPPQGTAEPPPGPGIDPRGPNA